MADFTIQGAIAAIEALGPRIANIGENIMVGLTPVLTGSLQQSIHTEQTGSSTWFVGSDVVYAYYAENGRGVVRPKNAKYLHYWIGGAEIFSKRSGPYSGRYFAKKTAAQLNSMSFSL